MVDAAALGSDAAARLSALGTVTVEPGLSDDEIARVEQSLEFEFADDHRAFLSAGLPVGTSWPNWRDEGRRSLYKRLQLPVDGILFDVEWKQFWPGDWGPRPARTKDALRTARYRMARVPPMVPVHAHRYLPGGRGSFGHPVLSIMQTDVTVAGADLLEFVGHEFGSDGRAPVASRTVEFWSDLVS